MLSIIFYFYQVMPMLFNHAFEGVGHALEQYTDSLQILLCNVLGSILPAASNAAVCRALSRYQAGPAEPFPRPSMATTNPTFDIKKPTCTPTNPHVIQHNIALLNTLQHAPGIIQKSKTKIKP